MANLTPIPQPPDWRGSDEEAESSNTALQRTTSESLARSDLVEEAAKSGLVASEFRYLDLAWGEFQRSAVYRWMIPLSKFVRFLVLTFFGLSLLAIVKYVHPFLPIGGWFIVILSAAFLCEAFAIRYLGKFHERTVRELNEAFSKERPMLVEAGAAVKSDLAIKIHQVYIGRVHIYPEEGETGFEITIQLSVLNTSETPKFIDTNECTLRVATSRSDYLCKKVRCKSIVYQERKKVPMENTLESYELERRQYTKNTPGIEKWLCFRVDTLQYSDLDEGSKTFTALEVLEIQLTIKDILGDTYSVTEHPPWATKGILMDRW